MLTPLVWGHGLHLTPDDLAQTVASLFPVCDQAPIGVVDQSGGPQGEVRVKVKAASHLTLLRHCYHLSMFLSCLKHLYQIITKSCVWPSPHLPSWAEFWLQIGPSACHLFQPQPLLEWWGICQSSGPPWRRASCLDSATQQLSCPPAAFLLAPPAAFLPALPPRGLCHPGLCSLQMQGFQGIRTP